MILYALVCRSDGVVLCEGTYGGLKGNFPQITQALVDRLKERDEEFGAVDGGGVGRPLRDGELRTFAQDEPGGEDDPFCGLSDMLASLQECGDDDFYWGADAERPPQRRSAETSGYYFHAVRRENLVTVCLADDAAGLRHGEHFSFLERTLTIFRDRFAPLRIARANAYALDKVFSSDLRESIHDHNLNVRTLGTNAGGDQVDVLKAQIEDLKNVLGNNIVIMLQRGERIDHLMSKAERLEVEASVFSKRTDLLAQETRGKNAKCNIYVFAAVVAVAYVFAACLCGPSLSSCSG